MSEITPYKLDVTSVNANQGIKTGLAVAQTPGIILSDGQGGVKSAVPGTDYGMPLLTGNGAPDAATVGNLGQHYFDMMTTAAPYEYICVGYTAAGFVWQIYGDSGTNFAPRGHFISLDALEAAVEDGTVPEPTPGVAYYIGTVTPYDVYIWDSVANTWTNIGSLVGSSGGSSTTGIPPHGSEGQALFKLSDADYDVVWGDVDTAAIANGAVTAPKIADGAVTAEKIANSSVTKAKLAANATHSSATGTLTVAGWTTDEESEITTQTISVPGVTATNTVLVAPAPASLTAYGEAAVYCSAQADGTLTFICEDVPEVELTVNVIILV